MVVVVVRRVVVVVVVEVVVVEAVVGGAGRLVDSKNGLFGVLDVDADVVSLNVVDLSISAGRRVRRGFRVDNFLIRFGP